MVAGLLATMSIAEEGREVGGCRQIADTGNLTKFRPRYTNCKPLDEHRTSGAPPCLEVDCRLIASIHPNIEGPKRTMGKAIREAASTAKDSPFDC